MGTPSRQTDAFDYVLDNVATGRREIYRNDRLLIATGRYDLENEWLETFDAVGPWGTFPSAAPSKNDERDVRSAA